MTSLAIEHKILSNYCEETPKFQFPEMKSIHH